MTGRLNFLAVVLGVIGLHSLAHAQDKRWARGCDVDKQVPVLDRAVSLAQANIGGAQAYLRDKVHNKPGAFNNYFGDYNDSDTRSIVTTKMKAIEDASNWLFGYNCEGFNGGLQARASDGHVRHGCDAKRDASASGASYPIDEDIAVLTLPDDNTAIAYVNKSAVNNPASDELVPGDLVIYLCPPFWDLTDDSIVDDSQANVIVHEISHWNLGAGTKDTARCDHDSCQTVPAAAAVKNAYSYAWFIESKPNSGCSVAPGSRRNPSGGLILILGPLLAGIVRRYQA